MQYVISLPPPQLTNYIRYCWQLENKTKSTLPRSFSVITDGCPGLIVQRAKSGVLYQGDKQLPTMMLYGQSTRHTQLHLPDTVSLLGICFQPNALKTVFGLDAHGLTDSCLDAQDLNRNRETYLLNRLLHASPANSFDLLFAYVMELVQRKNQAADPLVVQALTQMVGQGGNISLKKLQDTLRVSERSLERRFKQHVGISPKLFTRICQFQTSLNQLKNKNYDKLSDIAFDGGYADQSHFTRTFKAFAGVLPEQFHTQAHEVTGDFPELIA